MICRAFDIIPNIIISTSMTQVPQGGGSFDIVFTGPENCFGCPTIEAVRYGLAGNLMGQTLALAQAGNQSPQSLAITPWNNSAECTRCYRDLGEHTHTRVDNS